MGEPIVVSPTSCYSELALSSQGGGPSVPVDADGTVARIGHFREFLKNLAERLIGRELRTRVAASDVVQLTLLAAVRDHQRLCGATEQQLREWLVAILKHRVADEWRRLRSCRKRDFRREHALVGSQPRFAGRGPESEVIAREQITELLNAIEALDPLSRTIVRARYIDDQSFPQIGQQLGMSHDAVRRRWLGAMEAIGRRLGKEPSH